MKNYFQLHGSSYALKIISLILLVLAALSALLLLFQMVGGDSMSDAEAGQGMIKSMANKPGLARLFLFLQHFLIFICVPIVYQRVWYSTDKKSLFRWGRPEGKDFFRFTLLLILIFPVIAVTALWLSHLELPDWMQTLDEDYMTSLKTVMSMSNTTDIIITLFIAAVLPGVGEELLFRGTIQQELINHGKKPQLAVWMTAFLFSLLHFQASGFLAKLLIGAVLGYAYLFTRSLWVPVVLHFMNNAAATYALYHYKDTEPDTNVNTGFSYDQLLIFSVSILMIILYFTYLVEVYKKE